MEHSESGHQDPEFRASVPDLGEGAGSLTPDISELPSAGGEGADVPEAQTPTKQIFIDGQSFTVMGKPGRVLRIDPADERGYCLFRLDLGEGPVTKKARDDEFSAIIGEEVYVAVDEPRVFHVGLPELKPDGAAGSEPDSEAAQKTAPDHIQEPAPTAEVRPERPLTVQDYRKVLGAIADVASAGSSRETKLADPGDEDPGTWRKGNGFFDSGLSQYVPNLSPAQIQQVLTRLVQDGVIERHPSGGGAYLAKPRIVRQASRSYLL
jgi:hypothetical protein